MARGDIAMRVQMREITPKEGVAEIRKLQLEAKALSDSVRDFGKGRPGASGSSTGSSAAPAAQVPASTGAAPAKRPADKDPLGLFQ